MGRIFIFFLSFDISLFFPLLSRISFPLFQLDFKICLFSRLFDKMKWLFFSSFFCFSSFFLPSLLGTPPRVKDTQVTFKPYADTQHARDWFSRLPILPRERERWIDEQIYRHTQIDSEEDELLKKNTSCAQDDLLAWRRRRRRSFVARTARLLNATKKEEDRQNDRGSRSNLVRLCTRRDEEFKSQEVTRNAPSFSVIRRRRRLIEPQGRVTRDRGCMCVCIFIYLNLSPPPARLIRTSSRIERERDRNIQR